jgi:hypothetical protein
VKIRRYRPSDQAAVIALFREFMWELTPPHLGEEFQSYIETAIRDELGRVEEYYFRRDGQSFWVVDDPRVVGMVGVERSSAECAELRRMAVEMIDDGVRYGIASGQADELVALTNQRLKLVSLIYARIPEYVDLTATQDRIVVITENVTPVAPVTWNGAVYEPAGITHKSEIMQWTVYQRR